MSSQSIKTHVASTSTTTSSPQTHQFSPPTLKVPIRPLHSSSINSYSTVNKNISSSKSNNNWLPTSPTFSNSINVTFPVNCEQSTNSKNIIGKTTKRGRKPLSTMPSAKKHIQNLTNQRAFRQRREDYRKTLESKNADLEALYRAAKNEIESLKEKLASLEKQIKFGNVSDSNGTVDNIMNSTSHLDHDRAVDNSCCNIIGTSDSTNMFVSSSFIEEDTHLFHQLKDLEVVTLNSGKQGFITPAHNTPETVDEILLNPLFCETKRGDLCLCEPASDNLITDEKMIDEDNGGNVDQQYNDSYQTPLTSSQIENYNIDKKSGRIWIVPKEIVEQCLSSETPLYSTTTGLNSDLNSNNTSTTYNVNLLSSPVDSSSIANQWDNYYSPTSIPSPPSSSINPLDQNYLPPYFKWVLKDMRMERNL